ncbi:MAG: hypothetical protein C4288_21515 [Leptolyngbya sp. ERB_1_1]
MDRYAGNLKSFLNDYIGKYAPKDPTHVAELGAMFRQTMQSVYTAFGEHSGRLYYVDDNAPQDVGRWETKFSISALDIQASALIGYSPAKIQPVAKSIREAYKFYLATNPQVRAAISRRPAGKEATKTRWFGFKAVVQELMSGSANSGTLNEPLFEAKALFRAGYFAAAGAFAGVLLERRLKDLCTKQTPPLTSRGETINPLNDALKAAQIYDQTQHRRIQVMGDIRNRCSHSVSNPPSKDEVWELIEDVHRFLCSYPTD